MTPSLAAAFGQVVGGVSDGSLTEDQAIDRYCCWRSAVAKHGQEWGSVLCEAAEMIVQLVLAAGVFGIPPLPTHLSRTMPTWRHLSASAGR